MIVKNDKLKHPRGNKKIWRYMDLPKFLDLVTSGELYFANVSSMSDQYEGLLPQSNVREIKKILSGVASISEKESEAIANRSVENIRQFKKFTLVNCWSMHTIESFALWKIYLGVSGSGVAIRTNAKALVKSLGDSGVDIQMGEVSYKNYIKEQPDILNITTRKSPFYSYEEELRLFIINQFELIKNEELETEMRIAKFPNGLKVPIDVNELIQEIYISPFMGDWFEEMLRKTLKEINPALVDKIKRSEIQDY